MYIVSFRWIRKPYYIKDRYTEVAEVGNNSWKKNLLYESVEIPS